MSVMNRCYLADNLDHMVSVMTTLWLYVLEWGNRMCMFSSPEIAIAVKMTVHVFVVCESKKKTRESTRSCLMLKFQEGRKDVVVSPRHVQRLPSLPQWWEWLEGTCPDRVGGCCSVHPKHPLLQTNTDTHTVLPLGSSQILARPQEFYRLSHDTQQR